MASNDGEVMLQQQLQQQQQSSSRSVQFAAEVSMDDKNGNDGTQQTVSSVTNNHTELPLPRLVQRNLPFAQSQNRVRIGHNQGYKIYMLLRHDWFHVILRLRTSVSLLILLTIWTSAILIFAGLYVWVDNRNPEVNCGLGLEGNPIRFGSAFAFALETCTTGMS
jgi:hypothetical protein